MSEDKLAEQIEQLKNASSRLAESLELPPTEINKDAAIQRFEFTFELAWKTMKSVLENDGLQTHSPRETIRMSADIELIDDVDLWFDFLDARNNASHTYSQEIANDVYEKAKLFLPQVQEVLKRMEPK